MNDHQTPEVHLTCVSNIYSRQMHFLKAGDIEHGHMHCFDHITLLAKGKLRITALGNTTEFTAPHQIFIRADVEHELVALEDDTVAYCIHALRDFSDPQTIVDPSMLPIQHDMDRFNSNNYFPLLPYVQIMRSLNEKINCLETELAKYR